jgi:hypothetical protein
MKLFAFSLVVFLSVSGFSSLSPVWGAGIDLIAPATLPVVGLSSNGKAFQTFGSGFVFQWKRRIVTTATVIDSVPAKYLIPESNLGVLTRGGSKGMGESNQFHSVKVAYIDRERNIALLTVDSDLDVSPIQRVDKNSLKVGNSLSVSGWTSKGLVPSYFEGAVSFVTESNNGTPSYSGLGFPVGEGSTGGPAFNSHTGDLLGIVQLKTRFVGREVFPGEGAIAENLGSAIVIPVKTLLDVMEEQKE